MLMFVGYSDVFAAQSDALDYIYQIHNAAANVAFAQQMAVSYFWPVHHWFVHNSTLDHI